MVHAHSNEKLSFSWLLFGQSRYVACKFWRFQTWKVYIEQPMETPKEVLLCPAMNLLFIRLFPGRHPMCVGDCTETLGAELLEVSVARSVLFLNAYIILDALQN